MDMIKPELHVVQQIRRDNWDHHHHHQNNLGLIGILENQISVPVQTNAYQDCTTSIMNNPQGSSNWRSTDYLSQPSSMNCSVVNYGYDQDGISYVEDVFSNHTLGRPDYAGRDTMVHSRMTSRSEFSCLEDNQKGLVTVACSGTGNEILKSSQGSSSGSHRGELLFLPSLEDQSVAHNASRWNHGLSCKEPLNLTATSHTNKKGVSFSSLSSKIPPLRDGGNADTSSTVNVHKHFGPLGPFTGYASILKSSRFLEPAQKMLEEFCISYASNIVSGSESTSMDNDDSWGMLSSTNHAVDRFNISSQPLEPKNRLKRAKLLFMQEEVIKSYKLYNHQLQTVGSSFNSVAGLSTATPYISLALRRISTTFKDLVTVISEQLKQISTQHSSGGDNNEFQKQQRSLIGNNNAGFAESEQQHIWKPQRGLPERAVSVLRAWLFDHFLHPYPTDSDKQMLATQTGLSRNQVSNWFINARVRLWKPMVEEIHMLETKAIKNADTSYNVESSKRPNIVSSPSHEETLIMNLPGTKRSRFNNVWDNDMDMRNFHRGIGNVSLELRLRHGVDNVIQTQTQDDLFRQCYPNAS